MFITILVVKITEYTLQFFLNEKNFDLVYVRIYT